MNDLTTQGTWAVRDYAWKLALLYPVAGQGDVVDRLHMISRHGKVRDKMFVVGQ